METFIAEHFLESMVLVLLGALFFKETLSSFVNAKLGVKEKTPEWASRLQGYFNHDTTSHHNETHKKLDEVKDGVLEGNRLLREIKEYGIVCRDKK